MASNTEAKKDARVDLYIASYEDAQAAQQDWESVKQMAKEDVIDVDGLLFLGRDKNGSVVVKDDAHDVRKGVKVGAVAGAVVGLIFPPAVIGSAVVGALAGAGVGGLRSRGKKHEIREDIENVLPQNSSGIVVMLREESGSELEAALGDADNVTKHELDPESAHSIKEAVEK
jgi:uncharacterized membrane protein